VQLQIILFVLRERPKFPSKLAQRSRMAVFGLEFPPQPLDRFLQKLGSNCFHLINLMAE
jgi:hypothetical protein